MSRLPHAARARRALAGLGALLTVAAGAGSAQAALTPTITEHALPSASSQPFGVTAGPDGALWTTQGTGDGLARMTTAGAVTSFTTPSSVVLPWAIVTGADGNLWAAELQGSAIARVTPGGVSTEFPLPTAAAEPNAVAAGPDGQVWFTEGAAGQVGHISPSGTIVEIALPSPTSSPSGIAAGPDGNLWITEAGANAVARVTPSGTITEFPVPTPSANVLGIAAGSDGNLWFTELDTGRIGRITPAGAITEFPLPTAGAQPLMIAAGPDGALWFSEAAGNAIGRVTTVGAIEEYPLLSANAQPGSIALGPDGNLWFSETQAGALARITTPPAIGAAALSAIDKTSVTVSAPVSAHVQGTRAHIEYGPTTGYGSSTTDQAFSTGSPAPVQLTWSVTGLRAGTVHLRVVATNATGTTYGPDVTFATTGAPVTPPPISPPADPTVAPPAHTPVDPPSPGLDLTGPPTAPVLDKVAAKRRPSTVATLLGPSVVVVRHGRVPLTLGCPEAAVGGCAGDVSMRTVAPQPKGKQAAARAARCARGCRPLGKVMFQAKAGKKRRVSVKLSSAGRGLLTHAPSLKALVTVTTVVDGESTTTRRTITLRTHR